MGPESKSPLCVQLFGGADDESVLQPVIRRLATLGLTAELCVLTCGHTETAMDVELPATIDPVEFHEQLIDRMRFVAARAMQARLPDGVVLAPGYARLVPPLSLPAHPRTLVLVSPELPDLATLLHAVAHAHVAALGGEAAQRVRRATGRPPRLTLPTGDDDWPAPVIAAVRDWLSSRASKVAAWRAHASTVRPAEAARVGALRFTIEDH